MEARRARGQMTLPLEWLAAEGADSPWRLGLRAEDSAAAFLQSAGYEILARRFRARGGEIDIIALDGEVLVFVEVKARSTRGFGAPGERVGALKRGRIARVAAAYLLLTGADQRVCRFDVIEIEAGARGHAVRHLRDAFRLDSGLR